MSRWQLVLPLLRCAWALLRGRNDQAEEFLNLIAEQRLAHLAMDGDIAAYAMLNIRQQLQENDYQYPSVVFSIHQMHDIHQSDEEVRH